MKKNWRSQNFEFLGKKIWRNVLALKSKKLQGMFGGNVYFGIIICSCLLSTKPCLRFLLICFARKLKGFNQSSLENKADFTDIMNVCPNTLTKNKNFKKLRQDFVDERAMITTTLWSSCHWQTLVPFYLRKKKPEKALLTLTVNYRKIVQKNKLCHSKQQQINYLMIYDVI